MTQDGFSIIQLFWSFFQFFRCFEIPGTNVTPAQFLFFGSSIYLFIKLVRRSLLSESAPARGRGDKNDS